MHGAGPEGSPGAGGCPGRAGKGGEGSRVLSNAATDVLHEGAEAQGGGLGTRRLAAGEGLPGGRHRLGEHANSSSCLAPSGLRFCGDPPTILRARSASYASEACLGASEDASRPQARLSSSVNLSFHPRFVACGAASSPALLLRSMGRAAADPTRVLEEATPHFAGENLGPACVCGPSPRREDPPWHSSDVFEQGDSPRAPGPDGSGRYPAGSQAPCSTPSSPVRGTRTARRPRRRRRTRRRRRRWNV